ncbi:HAD family hydrolase [Bacillus chungangensis]|uniref:Hydrolase of the HAD superfamily n=1 Tax=Bacillus chungangensis TaxID=587633 RepID=A0ABT9WXH5_9BACI|nr:HAD family hydrolase [Bacillus chungangensis]MDQ0177997.1 putative hydrolase of the HAD superfamily [Bacillus chungangensis]
MKAVLFDLDGTLLDRETSIRSFIDDQYKRLSSFFPHVSKQAFMIRFITFECHGYVWKDQVYQQLVKEFSISGVAWEQLFNDYQTSFHQHCTAFPHLTEMLEELKKAGYFLGIVTNGKGDFQMATIRALNIETFFHIIVISEWAGVKKPDPTIFTKALCELGVPAQESIFIGDHVENDIKAAHHVGMKTIWKRNDQWNDVAADAVIDDLIEIKMTLQRFQKKINLERDERSI